MPQLPKNLQLLLSASIVLPVALLYGAHPTVVLPFLFDFEVKNLELINIFRAIMGVYLAFAFFWLYGIFNSKYWRTATILNVLFMGGLAAGRLISTFLNGWSTWYGAGMIAEAAMMYWGIWNLKNQKAKEL